MSFVAAVKQAITEGHDFWMLNLPEDQKSAYFNGYQEKRRENGDEFSDYLMMKASARALKDEGVRLLCF